MMAPKESQHTLMTRMILRNAHVINKSYIIHRKLPTAFSNAVALGSEETSLPVVW